MIFLISWLVGSYVKTRGMVECLAGGMSAAGSEVMTAMHSWSR